MQNSKQIPVSLAQHTVPRWTPPEMIEHAARIGYDCVSIRAIPQGVAGEAVFSLSADRALLVETRARIRDTGVFIHDIDLVAIDERRDIAALERELDAAASLGVSGVVTSIWTSDRALYEDKFCALSALAKAYGLTVHLEFVTWSEIKTVSAAAALLNQVHADNARILLDTIHFYRSRCTLEDIRACDPTWFELVHLCDAPAAIPTATAELIATCRTARLYPDEGAIPIRTILAALPNLRTVSVEIPNAEYTARFGAYGHAERACRAVRTLLGR